MKKLFDSPIFKETFKSLIFVNCIVIGLTIIQLDTHTSTPMSDYFFISSMILLTRTIFSSVSQSGTFDILKFGLKKIFNVGRQHADLVEYKNSLPYKPTYSFPKCIISFIYFIISFLLL